MLKLAELMMEGSLKPILGHTFEFSERGLRDAQLLVNPIMQKGKLSLKKDDGFLGEAIWNESWKSKTEKECLSHSCFLSGIYSFF